MLLDQCTLRRIRNGYLDNLAGDQNIWIIPKQAGDKRWKVMSIFQEAVSPFKPKLNGCI
jgi:hypothetical protein